MSSQTRNTRSARRLENCAHSHLVFRNDDLLTEILIRLPILSIHLFINVSKQWLQILTSPDFTDRRRKIPNVDPPVGILSNHVKSLYYCDFVSLDSRVNSKKSTMGNFFGSDEYPDQVRILQSCNGLLLCTGSEWPCYYYVYNPSTHSHRRLPQPKYYHREDDGFFSRGVFRLAFDPKKSIHYKVVLAECTSAGTWIHIYSSDTGNWSFCREEFGYYKFEHFESAMYWNDAFHWIEGLNRELKHFRLNIQDNEHPLMTTSDIPHGLHRGRKFLESYGGPCTDQNLLLMEIPHILHLDGKFFESLGCLLLVCKDDIDSNGFSIYEIMKGSSVWSVRYHVNVGQPLPEGWSIRTSVWSICLGEGEEDAFVLINISGKVVKYNLILKTNTDIFDDDDDDTFFYVPPFEVDPKIYEFIPSLASV